MHQNHSNQAAVDVRIKLHCVVKKIINPRDRLDACKAPTRNNDSQQIFSNTHGALKVGFLQQVNQPVAEMDSVPERLHRQSPFLQAWNSIEISCRSQSNDQVLVLDLVQMTLWTVDDSDPFFEEIDCLHFSVEELRFSQQFANWIYDVCDVQVARGHLMQHGGEEEEVFAVYKRDFDVRLARQQSFQLHCGIKRAKSAPQDQDAISKPHSHGRIPLSQA